MSSRPPSKHSSGDSSRNSSRIKIDLASTRSLSRGRQGPADTPLPDPNKRYDTRESSAHTSDFSRSSSQDLRESGAELMVVLNAAAIIPQGPEADLERAARILKETPLVLYEGDYSDPNSDNYERLQQESLAKYATNYGSREGIKNEIIIFNHVTVSVIQSLEYEIRKLVFECQKPVYKITFKDADSIGAKHAVWTWVEHPDTIKDMPSSKKNAMLKLAREEIQALRLQLLGLQRIAAGRYMAGKEGASYNQLTYAAPKRPADTYKTMV